MALDPVCSSEVDEYHARNLKLMLERDGRWYFFCSEPCKRQFEQNWPAIGLPWAGGWEATGGYPGGFHE